MNARCFLLTAVEKGQAAKSTPEQVVFLGAVEDPDQELQCVILQMHAGSWKRLCIKRVIHSCVHPFVSHGVVKSLFADEKCNTFCHISRFQRLLFIWLWSHFVSFFIRIFFDEMNIAAFRMPTGQAHRGGGLTRLHSFYITLWCAFTVCYGGELIKWCNAMRYSQ